MDERSLETLRREFKVLCPSKAVLNRSLHHSSAIPHIFSTTMLGRCLRGSAPAWCQVMEPANGSVVPLETQSDVLWVWFEVHTGLTQSILVARTPRRRRTDADLCTLARATRTGPGMSLRAHHAPKELTANNPQVTGGWDSQRD
jgi:hypothetical protein